MSIQVKGNNMSHSNLEKTERSPTKAERILEDMQLGERF